jgi:hypothetical protein
MRINKYNISEQGRVRTENQKRCGQNITNCGLPHFLVVFPDLSLPCLLSPEVVLRLVAQNLHRGYVQVHQDVPEHQIK